MDQAVSVGGAFYNLGIVTLGNIIGGAIMVAVPYYFASRKDPVE
jgi:nitrite transporter NirC